MSCRICWEAGGTSDVCACRAAVHIACLARWLQTRYQQGHCVMVCEICRAPYRVPIRLAPTTRRVHRFCTAVQLVLLLLVLGFTCKVVMEVIHMVDAAVCTLPGPSGLYYWAGAFGMAVTALGVVCFIHDNL